MGQVLRSRREGVVLQISLFRISLVRKKSRSTAENCFRGCVCMCAPGISDIEPLKEKDPDLSYH